MTFGLAFSITRPGAIPRGCLRPAQRHGHRAYLYSRQYTAGDDPWIQGLGFKRWCPSSWQMDLVWFNCTANMSFPTMNHHIYKQACWPVQKEYSCDIPFHIP
ncbi:unnamed protein product [Caretta caretta]